VLLAEASVADVASIVTGLVTIALVCVTYASVAVARNAASAASASAEMAAKQLQEAQRPVLIPGTPRQDDAELEIPVGNIGTGPALRIFAVARFLNKPPNVIGRFPEHVLPGVAADGELTLRLRMQLGELVSLRVTYADIAGRSYTTEATWDRRLGRFTHTTVAEGDTVRVPVTVRIGTPALPPPDPLGEPPAKLTLRAWLSPNPRRSRPDQALGASWLAKALGRSGPPRR